MKFFLSRILIEKRQEAIKAKQKLSFVYVEKGWSRPKSQCSESSNSRVNKFEKNLKNKWVIKFQNFKSNLIYFY